MSTSATGLIINDLLEITDYFVNLCDAAGITISDEIAAKIQHVSQLMLHLQQQLVQQSHLPSPSPSPPSMPAQNQMPYQPPAEDGLY